MLIIDQSHEILAMHIDPELIELAGRTCYRSEDRIGCTLDEDEPAHILCEKECSSACRYHSSHKFVSMIMGRSHDSVLEHSLLTVHFITNRGVTHEIVRHRLASFSQESTRYVNYEKKGVVVIRPPHRDLRLLGEWDTTLRCEVNLWDAIGQPDFNWLNSMVNAEHAYLTALRLGERPEQARGVLPNDLKTEIVVSANAREWRHIFKLRTAKAAHPDMRALMIPLLRELQSGDAAILFNDIEVKE